MKNVLLINGDLFKTVSTDFLMDAYRTGVMQADGIVHDLRIADLLFNYNIQLPSLHWTSVEADLQFALRRLHWAKHIVLFCPVYRSYIPSKIKGFFDRLFLPYQSSLDVNRIDNNFYGKSARIVSILDQDLFAEYNLYKKTNFMSVKKDVFERCHISPVRTSAMGELHQLNNSYSAKWADKLARFGRIDLV